VPKENAKLNVYIKTTTKNEQSVQRLGKMSN